MTDILQRLAETIAHRKAADAKTSYVAGLFAAGLDEILKKVGEEAVETVLAAKSGQADRIVYETADLWFHSLVMLAALNLGPEDVLRELERRFGRSGLAEKASRRGAAEP